MYGKDGADPPTPPHTPPPASAQLRRVACYEREKLAANRSQKVRTLGHARAHFDERFDAAAREASSSARDDFAGSCAEASGWK